jgi:hypothetical protein
MEQQIQYCTTRDGVRLAYSVIGKGTPMVRTPHWFAHLEYDLKGPDISSPERDVGAGYAAAARSRCKDLTAARSPPIRRANPFEICVRHPVRRRPNSYDAGMDEDQTVLAPMMCLSCGKPMGLSRTIPASAGFRELQTFGCKDCGVWVTEATDSWPVIKRIRRRG